MEPLPADAPQEEVKRGSLLSRLAGAVLRRLVSVGLFLGIILLVGYCASDHKSYPGMAEFDVADHKIATNAEGIAHGNTPVAKLAATQFSATIKPMQSALFKGGSGLSLASGGEFLTYCQLSPDSIVFMVHVPELRNYKDPKTRGTLAELAWAVANVAAKNISFSTEAPTVVVGLRGLGSYGPIWSGKLGQAADTKTDDLDEKRRLYPFFLPPAAAK